MLGGGNGFMVEYLPNQPLRRRIGIRMERYWRELNVGGGTGAVAGAEADGMNEDSDEEGEGMGFD